MELHDLIGYLVHRTDVKMTNYFTKRLKPFEVTPEQWGIISVLCKHEGTTQKELAAAIDKDQTTVARMIQSMEKKEIIQKRNNAQDKRSQNLYITEKGHEIKNKILPVVMEAHQTVTSNLSEQEIQYLKELLNKLWDTKY
ncbi:MarR family winged helix-turn-helix transcriptional regulator [Niallia taxi]|uniref:MarR family winged helix-turn-helix transcriptional regulator n=1 Tax=Niallia taxi TaxID=2499688 RepID=UPI002E2357A7|nr:MarR family winged helix-turn-helix transcriptional regulator [Niallia taxi]